MVISIGQEVLITTSTARRSANCLASKVVAAVLGTSAVPLKISTTTQISIKIFNDVGMGVMNDFLSWCRHLLVPFLFHDLTSLYHPSFHGKCFFNLFH